MARLFADENFPGPVVEALRRRGHDVLTAHEAGPAGRGVSDPEILAFAHAARRAVLTLNRKHFLALHNSGTEHSGIVSGTEHSGIVACTFDPDWEGQANRIDEAIVALDDLAGQLLRVNRPLR